jgi:hypothetical protein
MMTRGLRRPRGPTGRSCAAQSGGTLLVLREDGSSMKVGTGVQRLSA